MKCSYFLFFVLLFMTSRRTGLMNPDNTAHDNFVKTPIRLKSCICIKFQTKKKMSGNTSYGLTNPPQSPDLNIIEAAADRE